MPDARSYADAIAVASSAVGTGRVQIMWLQVEPRNAPGGLAEIARARADRVNRMAKVNHSGRMHGLWRGLVALPLASCLLAALGAIGCRSSVETRESATGSANAALVSVPTGASCLEIDLQGPETVRRQSDVTLAGANVLLSGLPVGTYTGVAEAYSSTCETLDAGTAPDWVSDPFTVTIVQGQVTQLPIVLHPSGSLSVTTTIGDGGRPGDYDAGAGEGGTESSGDSTAESDTNGTDGLAQVNQPGTTRIRCGCMHAWSDWACTADLQCAHGTDVCAKICANFGGMSTIDCLPNDATCALRLDGGGFPPGRNRVVCQCGPGSEMPLCTALSCYDDSPQVCEQVCRQSTFLGATCFPSDWQCDPDAAPPPADLYDVATPDSGTNCKLSGCTDAERLAQVNRGVVGNWTGTVTTPWKPVYSIDMTLFADGHYATHCVPGSPADCAALYYGTDEDSPVKTYHLSSVLTDGTLSGTLTMLFSVGTTTVDDLNQLTLSNDGSALSFQIWHLKTAGPISLALTRRP